MLILKNTAMLIVTVVLGWWLYAEHASTSVDPRRFLPGTGILTRGSATGEMHGQLEALYRRVSAPLDQPGALDPARIETWKERCRSWYESGTLNQDQATAAWRLCRALEELNAERERLQASYAAAGGARTLDPIVDPRRAEGASEETRAQAAAAWEQLLGRAGPRCERYLSVLR